MAAGRRVLITGIAGELAALLAGELEACDDVEELIGVDVEPPSPELTRTEFVRADIRNPLVARVLEAAEIDTVVHMPPEPPTSGRSRAGMKERSVIGAMQLLAACQKAPSVRRFVLRSTTAVYGAAHDAPALRDEDDLPATPPKQGPARDAAEVEGYARAFARRRPDVELTVLRLASLVGPRVESALSVLLRLPVVPTIAGFDPRVQVCHQDDAVAALRLAVTGQAHGTFNVAGDGVLYLSQCLRLAGRLSAPVPAPLAAAAAAVVGRATRLDPTPDQLRFLRYGGAVDTTRMREVLGLTPQWSSRAALEDFVRQQRISGLLDREDVLRWERELYDFLQRRGQEQFLAQRRGAPRR